ncbi:MAG: hypothetical protein Kow0029_31590 [Candidatus Rifleibacteriota bacterium]
MFKKAILLILLSGTLFFSHQVHAQFESLIVEDSSGHATIIDADRQLENIKGPVKVKRTGIAEGYIFPDRAPAKKKYPPAEKILTGVFSERTKKDKSDYNHPGQNKFTDVSDNDVDLENVVQKEGPSIAWIEKNGEIYHDPFLECGSHTTRIFVSDLSKLNGLEPCRECFNLTGQAPAFIRDECGGLDLATAGALLDNSEFIEWVETHLPVKKAVFLTGRKLLIYPKQDMTDKGLKELAHETAMAYRRHTWKVIEVLGKRSETDPESVSSF